MAELPDLTGGYDQHGYSKSTPSLDTSSSSAGMVSPTSTLVSDSPFTPTGQQSRLPTANNNSNNSSRPCSQTFSFVPIDPTLLADEKMRNLQPSLESPIDLDMATSTTRGGYGSTNKTQKVLKRNRSNPEIKAQFMPPPSKSNTLSPITSPGSPTQDEARRALGLVMDYLDHQPARLAAQEYKTIRKLMERLEPANGQLLGGGGLPRIDEHDIPSRA
ncbi:hypothetical protein N7461_006136 [Penicillium sp. DV-2018c]|nr:hypothetical protein N7461_006136 [Penicillium sp. DV-2018c]